MDCDKDLVGALEILHREAVAEVQAAKNTVLKSRMLHKYGTDYIGVKRMGELDTEGWYELCKSKFSSEDKYGIWTSQLDGRLRSHDFCETMVVPDGKGGIKINEDDEELTQLHNEYGPLVANAVGVAALEIATWNPSGRCVVEVPWDFGANEKASMSQIFEVLLGELKANEERVKANEERVREMLDQLML